MENLSERCSRLVIKLIVENKFDGEFPPLVWDVLVGYVTMHEILLFPSLSSILEAFPQHTWATLDKKLPFCTGEFPRDMIMSLYRHSYHSKIDVCPELVKPLILSCTSSQLYSLECIASSIVSLSFGRGVTRETCQFLGMFMDSFTRLERLYISRNPRLRLQGIIPVLDRLPISVQWLRLEYIGLGTDFSGYVKGIFTKLIAGKKIGRRLRLISLRGNRVGSATIDSLCKVITDTPMSISNLLEFVHFLISRIDVSHNCIDAIWIKRLLFVLASTVPADVVIPVNKIDTRLRFKFSKLVLERIYLGDNQLTDYVYPACELLLQRIPSLKHMSVSGSNTLPTGQEYYMDISWWNKIPIPDYDTDYSGPFNLTVLDLSNNKMGSEFGGSIVGLGEIIVDTNIRILLLANNAITDRDINALLLPLFDISEDRIKLNCLDLSFNYILPRGCAVVAAFAARLPKLFNLNMSCNRITPKGASSLFDVASGCALSSLRLSNCSLTNSCLWHINNMLYGTDHLAELDLGGNQIRTFKPHKPFFRPLLPGEELLEFSTAVQFCKCLNVLNLSGISLTIADFDNFSGVFASSSISRLGLRSCNISDPLGALIVERLSCPLRYLDMSQNRVGLKTATALSKMNLPESLAFLRLNNCSFKKDDLAVLLAGLGQWSHLKELFLAPHFIPKVPNPHGVLINVDPEPRKPKYDIDLFFSQLRSYDVGSNNGRLDLT